MCSRGPKAREAAAQLRGSFCTQLQFCLGQAGFLLLGCGVTNRNAPCARLVDMYVACSRCCRVTEEGGWQRAG
jgi:hypothetical protein